MFYRVFPQKDSFITNAKFRNVQKTGSNFGSSEILHLYKAAGVLGAVGISASSSIARIITKFDTTNVLSAISDTGVSQNDALYYLKMFDARHDKTLPYSFDVEIQALSQDWDEGRGRDVDSFSDLGVANWDKAKSNVFWNVTGSEGVGPVVNCHFDTGHEDLEANITPIVKEWISGTFSNNGLLVKISSSQELDNSDYYIKMFHGRETFFSDKRPFIEARWDDTLKDDRNKFVFDTTGSLYLYHIVNGQFSDLPVIGTGSLMMKVVDASGTIATFTGSHTGRTGIYSSSFAIASSSYSGSLFRDVWYQASSSFMTGAFQISRQTDSTSVRPKRYYVNVVNMKNSYQTDENARLSLFVRPSDYRPARVLTASLDANGTTIAKAYYKILNDRTDEVVVPFSTGTVEYTRLSYDLSGNYFDLSFASLSPGNVYRLVFLFDVDGQKQLIDEQFKFKVL